mgnify:CR=1 FL=1
MPPAIRSQVLLLRNPLCGLCCLLAILLTAPDLFGGAIVHLGDNLTGKGDGDDEVITLDLTAIPPTVVHLAFTINSYSVIFCM